MDQRAEIDLGELIWSAKRVSDHQMPTSKELTVDEGYFKVAEKDAEHNTHLDLCKLKSDTPMTSGAEAHPPSENVSF